jgi:hypothetical protein
MAFFTDMHGLLTLAEILDLDVETRATRLKAVLTNDSAPTPPRSQPHRPKYDISFPHFHPLCDFRSCMAKC